MPTPTDLANRSLQYLGAQRISAGALFTEDSKNASEFRQLYDTVRRYELRRNVWRFSIRRTRLRAMSTASRLLTWPTWSSVVTYAAGEVVTGPDGFHYVSLVGANLNNTPASSLTQWGSYTGQMSADLHVAGTSYAQNDLVYVGGTTYRSLIDDNTDTPPTANWVAFVAAPALVVSPIAPALGRQQFRLPGNFLRAAHPDPKLGAVQFGGLPTGLTNDDYIYEGDFLLTGSLSPFVMRFAADERDPNKMDTMFYEALALRYALSLVEALTQSGQKVQISQNQYSVFMSEARKVNAIEQGPFEQPIDPLIEARY